MFNYDGKSCIATYTEKMITEIISKQDKEILSQSNRPRKYWDDLKKKLENEENFEVSERIGRLKMVAKDGKNRLTDCANRETIFRIIQSVPSPNAEPFKLWFARLAEEVNKQAKIIQWYEKENRHNQEIIIDLSKRIEKTTQAIDELLSYDDFKDITNAIFGNVKEELKFYLSNYKTLEEFRKANLKENDYV